MTLQRLLFLGLILGAFFLPVVAFGEARLLAGLPAWQTPFLDSAMQAVTRLGLGSVDIGLFVFIFCLGWWFESRGVQRVGLWGAGAVSAAGVLNQVLKHLLCRARPTAPEGGAFFARFPCFPAPYLYASFPSGHTTTAFAAATFVALWKPRWGPVAFVLAGLVGISRAYLGAHYPSDVLAGVLLGTGVALAGWRAMEAWSNGKWKTDKPKPANGKGG